MQVHAVRRVRAAAIASLFVAITAVPGVAFAQTDSDPGGYGEGSRVIVPKVKDEQLAKTPTVQGSPAIEGNTNARASGLALTGSDIAGLSAIGVGAVGLGAFLLSRRQRSA